MRAAPQSRPPLETQSRYTLLGGAGADGGIQALLACRWRTQWPANNTQVRDSMSAVSCRAEVPLGHCCRLQLLIDHTRQVCLIECFNHKGHLVGTSPPPGGNSPTPPRHLLIRMLTPGYLFIRMLIPCGSSPQRAVPRMLSFLCRRAGRICSPQGVGAIPPAATHQGPTYSLRSALAPLVLDALGPFSPHPASLIPRLAEQEV